MPGARRHNAPRDARRRSAPSGVRPTGTRARVERAALDLFALRGFENVTSDEVADTAGISRRTFFRYYATKADAVWGDFDGHVARLEGLLAADRPGRSRRWPRSAPRTSRSTTIRRPSCPLLRERMQLILTEPALLAHSQLRFAEVDRVVARHVADGSAPPQRARPPGAAAPGGGTTAFERRRRRSQAWLADELAVASSARLTTTPVEGGAAACCARVSSPG